MQVGVFQKSISMSRSSGKISLFEGVDRVAVLLYVVLVVIGFVNILSASYNDEVDMFSFSQQYIKQLVWIGAAFCVALVILLLDSRYYHMYAYYAYAFGLLFLAGTLIPGVSDAVKGAKAWYEFGPIRIQPVEFAKIATALAVARLMSNYNFTIKNFGHLVHVGLLILVPFVIILFQNDTGSGVVLSSFILVLYREGLNKWICIPIIIVAILFICSFLFTPLFLLTILLLVFTLSDAMMIGRWKMHLIFVTAIFFLALLLNVASHLLWDGALTGYGSLVVATIMGVVVAGLYAWKRNISAVFLSLALFVGSALFVPTADKIFESVLKDYQRDRIISFLGIIDDPKGIDYNVNQAKIAIGSGGFSGKGFMEGTQIRYGYVPEKHTDFIFCAVGEEWGFIGTMTVLALLCALIMRLMRMGERQEEPFSRIYSYCVASILLFHVFVNVGVTVGLFPVMGIPLPFLSYGGSSLLAFTAMVFIAIRLDSTQQTGVISSLS